MYKFDIYTDSSCDLPQEIVDQYDLKVMQLEVLIDDKPPILNKDVDIKEFYDLLRNGSMAKTAAATPGLFEESFRESLEAGKDVLYLGFSSGLSATYNNGHMMIEELKDEFPDRKLYDVDTLCASMGEGLVVYYAAVLREEGATIEEVCEKVLEVKDKIHHQVTVNDLFFLQRGGRVSATAAVAGSLLKVKPMIHVDKEGKLQTDAKIRGRKNAIKELSDRIKANFDVEKLPYVFISQGDCMDDVLTLKDMIQADFPQAQITISDVGPVIGAHTGPGVIALCYLGKNEKED